MAFKYSPMKPAGSSTVTPRKKAIIMTGGLAPRKQLFLNRY